MKNWIKELSDPKSRQWEEFYRNRWQHDKRVRSTHGVNCTGGCSWEVFVKDGIVTWEMQAIDYPSLESSLPPYEPRGCQRGISASWYIYSPIRVKYPYMRLSLMKAWYDARGVHADPVKAWESIVTNKATRKKYQTARGKGGFARISWEDVLEIIAASSLYTAKTYGTDRVIGFSPIPAMSYLSYGAGSRFLQLFGGVNLSFYDWYCDLPNAFPEVWGEQTDVCESADWYNAKYIVSMGSNLNMTRTPDVHFVAEAKQNGTKFVVFAPDFSQAAKFSDWWIPIKAGQDAGLWMAVSHIILKEYYVDKQVPYFIEYNKQFTDNPFLVELDEFEDGFKAGKFLRANKLAKYKDTENGDWKMVMYDTLSDEIKMPKGTIGHRYGDEGKGKWNLTLEDSTDDSKIDPALTLLDVKDKKCKVAFYAFREEKYFWREVPVKTIETVDGKTIHVTTVFDIQMGQFAVKRKGLSGDYANNYNDIIPYTPAWQEAYTGIGRDTVIRFAREFTGVAEKTKGKSMVIIGAGINHWYYNSLAYRAPINALLLAGCPGKNGGGMNHYVGQEKLTLVAPWSTIALAKDWQLPPRLQQAPIWHYMHTDQWRYEGDFTKYAAVPPGAKYAKGHTADHVAKAVRMGSMPFYPQFTKSNLDVVKDAKAAGSKTDQEIIDYTIKQLKENNLTLSVEDIDHEGSFPRVWFIWRGNALMSSAKGHEFFLRHYLGTHDNAIKLEGAEGKTERVKWHKEAPKGKMDLVIDINFRMDTSALYSDIVLPTAMWYEKNDLNSTDLHSYVHPLSEAVPPTWEAKSDWDIFSLITKTISEMSPSVFPEPVTDIVSSPLAHDSADEITQPTIKDWALDECDIIPGKTTSKYKIVERDFSLLHKKFTSLGPLARENGLSAHGSKVNIEEEYDELAQKPLNLSPDVRQMRSVEWGGNRYPSLEDVLDAANTILALAPETNGNLAYKAFKDKEERVGLPLADLAEGERSSRATFGDLQAQPRRTLTSPMWSGIVNNGRAYAAYTLNVERLVPWRTLTGRQSYYLDHDLYLDFGENIATYKSKLDSQRSGDISTSQNEEDSIVLNYLTPHGKWHIHSTYGDTHRMLTLSRGMEPCWIGVKDAERIGIKDNDWVEVFNDNGVYVTRAVVSARIQEGTCIVYHSPERTISQPKSNLRGNRRGGGHNSVTRIKLNPLLLAGGYAQFSYGFNYWGPVAVNRDTYVVIKKLKELLW